MAFTENEIEERTLLTGTNQFELLLFRLGTKEGQAQPDLYGINVFKVREIVTIPNLTPIAGASEYSLGVAHLRGQVIPVYDLPKVVGNKVSAKPTLMIVTEYARTTQAFAVESVEDIARLDWNQVISAEASGAGDSLVTSIARLDEGQEDTRLAQVLDVEAILQMISPEKEKHKVDPQVMGDKLNIKPGTIVLVADDSQVARSLLEQALKALKAPCEMVNSGKEAWDRLNILAKDAQEEGKTITDKVSVVLTDLEMPEMDGFTLTRNIKADPRFSALPVLIHSSLSGSANEAHVRSVGADGYVVKFSADELAKTLRSVLPQAV